MFFLCWAYFIILLHIEGFTVILEWRIEIKALFSCFLSVNFLLCMFFFISLMDTPYQWGVWSSVLIKVMVYLFLRYIFLSVSYHCLNLRPVCVQIFWWHAHHLHDCLCRKINFTIFYGDLEVCISSITFRTVLVTGI